MHETIKEARDTWESEADEIERVHNLSEDVEVAVVEHPRGSKAVIRYFKVDGSWKASVDERSNDLEELFKAYSEAVEGIQIAFGGVDNV